MVSFRCGTMTRYNSAVPPIAGRHGTAQAVKMVQGKKKKGNQIKPAILNHNERRHTQVHR